MIRSEFRAGDLWAYRKTTKLTAPASRVELVDYPAKVKKVKVRHVEGELKGLEEWVPPGQLRARWDEWPRLLRDEERLQAIYDHQAADPPADRVVWQAIEEVFDSTGEDVCLREGREHGKISDETLRRLCARAGVSAEERRMLRRFPGFKTADGEWFLPWRCFLDLAIAFAKAEPATVTRFVDLKEDEYRRKGYDGSGFFGEDLTQMSPSFALVRQWAGGRDDRLSLMQAQLDELRALVLRSIRHLDDAGERPKATALERDLRRLFE